MKSATRLEKEIERTREQLNRLETQLRIAQHQVFVKHETQEQKLSRLEAELKKKYPTIKIDRELLSLVGTLPRIPRRSERRIIRDAVAETYG